MRMSASRKNKKRLSDDVCVKSYNSRAPKERPGVSKEL